MYFVIFPIWYNVNAYLKPEMQAALDAYQSKNHLDTLKLQNIFEIVLLEAVWKWK